MFGMNDHPAKWPKGDFIAVCFIVLGIVLFGIWLYHFIPFDSPEEKERLHRYLDFRDKCFAMRGREYYNRETSEYECYHGPVLTFTMKRLEGK